MYRVLFMFFTFVLGFPSVQAVTPDRLVDRADVVFSVSKNERNVLTFNVMEKGREIFNQPIPGKNMPGNSPAVSLTQRDSLSYIWSYRGDDRTSIDLLISYKGDISLLNRSKTGYESRKSWGFNTFGKFINEKKSAFYDLRVKAQQIHNLKLLKLGTASLYTNYHFNRGIYDFGDETLGELSMDNYARYMKYLDKKANPSYKKHTLENYGAIISKNGLLVEGGDKAGTYKEKGITDTHKVILNKVNVEAHDSKDEARNIQKPGGEKWTSDPFRYKTHAYYTITPFSLTFEDEAETRSRLDVLGFFHKTRGFLKRNISNFNVITKEHIIRHAEQSKTPAPEPLKYVCKDVIIASHKMKELPLKDDQIYNYRLSNSVGHDLVNPESGSPIWKKTGRYLKDNWMGIGIYVYDLIEGEESPEVSVNPIFARRHNSRPTAVEPRIWSMGELHGRLRD